MCGRFHPDRFFEVRLSEADYEFLRRAQQQIEMRRELPPKKGCVGFKSAGDYSLEILLSQIPVKKTG